MLAGLLQFRRLQVIPLHLLDAADVGLLPSPLRQEGTGSARGGRLCRHTSHSAVALRPLACAPSAGKVSTLVLQI